MSHCCWGRWVSRFVAASLAGLVAAACGAVDHVDFPPDLDAQAADGGGDGSQAGDGPTCTPNRALDCAGYCGSLLDHCSTVVDCGPCPAGLACGTKTPNVCGPAACIPSCAGGSCGASDGCGGICSTGLCSTGQRCSAGRCVCDASSCSGCCSGTTCFPGTSPAACGTSGQLCATCPVNWTCSGTCQQVGQCPTTCVANTNCQATCPPVLNGSNCCDLATRICYAYSNPTCP